MPYTPTALPETDCLFGTAQLAEAGALAASHPEKMTNRQLDILMTYAPAEAMAAARAREKALAGPTPTVPLISALDKMQTGRVAALSALEVKTLGAAYGPEVAAAAAQQRTQAQQAAPSYRAVKGSGAPSRRLAHVEELLAIVIDFAKAVKPRLLALEAENVSLKAEVTALRAKSASLGVRWAGTFELDKEYQQAELVSGKGGLWLALKTTTTAPGMDPDAWRLILRAKA